MSTPDLLIREAQAGDWPALWRILAPVIRAGETYAIAPDIAEGDARALWLEQPRACYVAARGRPLLGTSYIKTNQPGGGSHVCNCGYVVAAAARGQGIAAALCRHSQRAARELGYRAMQFNLVLESNGTAIRLWERLGYATVGRLPRAFDHPVHGLVDARVMYKWLADRDTSAQP